MKKKEMILSLAMIFCSLHVALSQIAVAATVGTYNSTTKFEGLNETELLNFDPLNSFTGGIQVELPLDQSLSLKSGVNYKKKGFGVHAGTSFNVGGMDIPVGVKALNTIKTIEIPLLLSYYTPRIGKFQPYINVGPSISYAHSASLVTKASAIVDITLNKTEFDLSGDEFNRLGIIGNIALGTEVPYKSGFFLVEVGYDKALSNFTSESSLIDLGVNHSGIGIKIGYGMSF